MKCPACSDSQAYVGLSTVECSRTGCRYYRIAQAREVEKQRAEARGEEWYRGPTMLSLVSPGAKTTLVRTTVVEGCQRPGCACVNAKPLTLGPLWQELLERYIPRELAVQYVLEGYPTWYP